MDTIVTTWWATWDYLQSVPRESWIMLIAGIATLPIVSVAVETIKRWHFFRKGEELTKKWVSFWLGFSAFLVTALQGFIIYGTTNPKFLGERTLEVVGGATLLYSFLMSARYKKVAAALSKWVANGRAIKAQAGPAAPTVVPPNTEVPQADDPQSLII